MEKEGFGKKLKRLWKWQSRYPIIPIIILFVIVVCALFADLAWLGFPDIRLAPYAPNDMSLGARLTPPFFMPEGSTEHILGTDNIGRDILSRMIYGARISLSVSLLVIAIATIIGMILGMTAGYARGNVDAFIMRVTDAVMSFPALLIALLLAVALGPSFWTVVLAVSAQSWAPYSRMMRGEVVRLRDEDFVAQARIIGASPFRIMMKHLFPNIVNTLVVLMTMSVGLVILIEASLSFLGAGVPPTTPTWGSMASDGRNLIMKGWWISLFPSLAIGLVVLSCNFLGDWIRDKMDPRLRQL
jgi:peptide/nickel transport system permease protein